MTDDTEAETICRRRKSRIVVGPVLSLAMVAGLPMWASWGRGNHADRSIVAAYDGGVITKENLLERWRREPPGQRAALRTPEAIGATIQSLAAHAVLERWARERRLDARELFARAMREATKEIGIHDVEQRLHESDIRVEEGEIQQYFETNREKFKDRTLTQVRDEIRHLLHTRKEGAAVEACVTRPRDSATST